MSAEWESGVRAPERLAAVERSGLVGTAPEDEFDRLIEVAVTLLEVPCGVIALVDSDNTTAISSVGFPEGLELYAPVELSFCRFVVSTGRPLIVEDAHHDRRTVGDPAIDAFNAVSWAGYPIEDADGIVLGTFCVMDSKPHRWTAVNLQVLATLAKAASTEIALRRLRSELDTGHRR